MLSVHSLVQIASRPIVVSLASNPFSKDTGDDQT
jgi:hypothetical protein